MSTWMWQTEISRFRIQTDDPEIARKLSRRKRPQLVGFGINRFIRIYELSEIRPQNARRTFTHVLGQEIKLNPVTGEYEAKMHS